MIASLLCPAERGVDEGSCPDCQQTQVWKASEVGGVFEQFCGPEGLSEQCLTLDVEGSESTGSVTGIVTAFRDSMSKW